jgi:hypothetical protein
MEHCWAATTESLSRVEPRLGGPITQNDLIAAPWIQPHLNANHGLNMLDGFRALTTHFGMHFQGLAAGVATPSTFEAALRRSFVIVAYVVITGQASHVVLANGVSSTHLKIMDPYRGYLDVPFTTVNQSPLRLGFYYP